MYFVHAVYPCTEGDALARVADELGEPTRFVGFDTLRESGSTVRALLVGGAAVEEAAEGDEVTRAQVDCVCV